MLRDSTDWKCLNTSGRGRGSRGNLTRGLPHYYYTCRFYLDTITGLDTAIQAPSNQPQSFLLYAHQLKMCYYVLVVDQKGLSAEFLPKVSAEIWHKVLLCLFVLSVLLHKHYISAERPPFCRNFLSAGIKFLERPKFPFLHSMTLKMMHYSTF